VAGEVARLEAAGLVPGLAVVLVGEDPASEVYVRSRASRRSRPGCASSSTSLPAETPEAELLALIAG
jgi:methylenetetrahydrofolate dehydrogenase (NADP+) / methenyltetrahydrofolate cyclohydrolase